MRTSYVCCVVLGLLAPVTWSQASKLPPLANPRGLAGSLLLTGSRAPDALVRKRFVGLAAKPKPTLVLLFAPRSGLEVDGEREAWQAAGAREVERLSLPHPGQAEHLAGLVERLARARLVWIESGAAPALFPAGRLAHLAATLLGVVAKGGAVGGAGTAGELLGGALDQGTGLGLLPQALFCCGRGGAGKARLEAALGQWPGHVGFLIPAGGALLFQGRAVTAVGGGASKIVLLPSKQRPLLEDSLDWRHPADFNQLARAARARTRPPFPPAKLERSGPARGTLIIVGGGRLTGEILKTFVAAAGGARARVAVIPTAVADPLPKRQPLIEALQRAGVAGAWVLHARTPAEAARPAFLKKLASMTGVWFGGGRQWRLVDAYLGGPVPGILRQILHKGGVIGGSSAGATIMGEYLVRGHPLGNTIMMAEGYEHGLALLKGAAIDQHFTQRNRFKDLERVKRRFPQLLCLGIDESTALVVKGSSMQVMGLHGVAVYDHPLRLGAEPGYTALKAGDRYNLKTLRKLP